MSKVYHYDDDFFIIDGLVRVIHDASTLEPDDEIIGDTLLSMIRTADSVIRKVKAQCIDNNQLINRTESTRLLANSAQKLYEAIDSFTRQEPLRLKSFASSKDELVRMIMAHKACVKEMRELMQEQDSSQASKDHVSEDELSGLLG